LTLAFNKIAGTKKLQVNAFFAGKRFFAVAKDENLASYVSQRDGGLKKNNPYLIKLVGE
jgi:hypothetical protein